MELRAKKGGLCETNAWMRANQIARMTSDFKMDVTNKMIIQITSNTDNYNFNNDDDNVNMER